MQRRSHLAVLLLTVPFALWALVRTAGLDLGHPLVAFIAWTPHVALLSAVPLAAALVLRAWPAAVLAAASAALLAAAVLPRAVAGPSAAGSGQGPRLVVMTSNLLGGDASMRAVVRIARQHRVDVLSLQELTAAGIRRLDRAGIRELLPHRVLAPRPQAAGSGLMSRYRLDALADDGSARHAQPQARMQLPGGRSLVVKAVHPYPPISRADAAAWKSALRALPSARDGGLPHLLLGDFNATLDHRELRRLLDRGYVDAADAAGAGLRATWPRGRLRPGIAIDHVLVPRGAAVASVEVVDVPGSDHRAVIAELVLPGWRTSARGNG